MPNKYPYVSGPGGLTSTITQLRKAFPDLVNAEALQKWGLAPNNESYVLNVVRFLGLIDEEGKKNKDAAKDFLKGDADFTTAFERIVKTAYKALFDHFGEDAWSLELDRLMPFFRTEDESSETVGKRQAGTFRALAALAGHGEVVQPKSKVGVAKSTSKPSRVATKQPQGAESAYKPIHANPHASGSSALSNNMGLTVRVEINLPAIDDQAVYDKIFRSIRANLIDGKPAA